MIVESGHPLGARRDSRNQRVPGPPSRGRCALGPRSTVISIPPSSIASHQPSVTARVVEMNPSGGGKWRSCAGGSWVLAGVVHGLVCARDEVFESVVCLELDDPYGER